MKQTMLSGCCVAKYFWDLGNAHNIPRAKDFNAFVKRLMEVFPYGFNSIQLTFTNHNQTKEREWLEKCGFSVVKKSTGVWLHVATRDELQAKLQPMLNELRAKAREEARERAARAKENRKAQSKVKFSKSNPHVDFYNCFDIQNLRRLTAADGRTPEEAFRTFLGVTLNLRNNTWIRTNSSLLRALNTAIG